MPTLGPCTVSLDGPGFVSATTDLQAGRSSAVPVLYDPLLRESGYLRDAVGGRLVPRGDSGDMLRERDFIDRRNSRLMCRADEADAPRLELGDMACDIHCLV